MYCPGPMEFPLRIQSGAWHFCEPSADCTETSALLSTTLVAKPVAQTMTKTAAAMHRLSTKTRCFPIVLICLVYTLPTGELPWSKLRGMGRRMERGGNWLLNPKVAVLLWKLLDPQKTGTCRKAVLEAHCPLSCPYHAQERRKKLPDWDQSGRHDAWEIAVIE